jgi:predicted ATP-dependent serine protease
MPVERVLAAEGLRSGLAASESAAKLRIVSTGFPAWDAALGGGVVLGSVLVVHGPPGVRKSTFGGAIAEHVGRKTRRPALMISAEMPRAMAINSVRRLVAPESLRVLGREDGAAELEAGAGEVMALRPAAVVWDSIQRIAPRYAPAGSDRAVRAVLAAALDLSSRGGSLAVAIVIAQENKGGAIAGSARSLFDCDIVVRLTEGEVHARKNRFAPSGRAALT